MGRQDFFLQSADGQDSSAQGDLTGHGDRPAHRDLGDRRYDAGGEGAAGRRPVFGNRAFGEVNMHIDTLKEIPIKSEERTSGTHIAHRRRTGLFHDVTKLAGHRKLALSGHNGHFNRQKVSADFRPSHAVGQADFIGFLNLAEFELMLTQEFLQTLGCNAMRFRFALGGRRSPRRLRLLLFLATGHHIFGHDLLSHLSANRRDLPFKVPHSGFPGVIANDVAYGRIGKTHLAVRQPVNLHLLGDKVFLGDIKFLAFDITFKMNDLHAIEQRSRHRV